MDGVGPIYWLIDLSQCSWLLTEDHLSGVRISGDPLLLPLNGDANVIADVYWKGLDHENRISLFTREFVEKDDDNLKIINRFHP